MVIGRTNYLDELLLSLSLFHELPPLSVISLSSLHGQNLSPVFPVPASAALCLLSPSVPVLLVLIFPFPAAWLISAPLPHAVHAQYPPLVPVQAGLHPIQLIVRKRGKNHVASRLTASAPCQSSSKSNRETPSDL